MMGRCSKHQCMWYFIYWKSVLQLPLLLRWLPYFILYLDHFINMISVYHSILLYIIGGKDRLQFWNIVSHQWIICCEPSIVCVVVMKTSYFLRCGRCFSPLQISTPFSNCCIPSFLPYSPLSYKWELTRQCKGQTYLDVMMWYTCWRPSFCC